MPVEEVQDLTDVAHVNAQAQVGGPVPVRRLGGRPGQTGADQPVDGLADADPLPSPKIRSSIGSAGARPPIPRRVR